MGSALKNLFSYAADHVTLEDIAKYSFGDPGYKNYVREMSQVWQTREIPTRRLFDLTENINLNLYDNSEDDPHFLRFRIFGAVIGVAIQYEDDAGFSINYHLLRLLQDAETLGDEELKRLLQPAFLEFYAALQSPPLKGRNCEYPFALLAAILTEAGFIHPDMAMISTWTQELLRADAELCAVGNVWGDGRRPVLGLSNYDHLHDLWLGLIRHRLEKIVIPPVPEFLAALS